MPLMVEICCGNGGWTEGFMSEGWDCRGYDIRRMPSYRGTFVLCDILALTAREIADADHICCSTPCQGFALHCMRHFHPSPPYPTVSLQLFDHARRLCDATGKPYIMENVRCAQQFIGAAVQHVGPFYLWGNAVPAIFPRELYSLVKGCYQRTREQYSRLGPGGPFSHRHVSATTRSAGVATIPLELSRYVAQVANNTYAAKGVPWQITNPQTS